MDLPADPAKRLEKLEAMKRMGFAIFGDLFKDTLAYVQIERMIREIDEKK